MLLTFCSKPVSWQKVFCFMHFVSFMMCKHATHNQQNDQVTNLNINSCGFSRKYMMLFDAEIVHVDYTIDCDRLIQLIN